ncbi:MAG: hypothetical protein ACPGWR_31555 [Ardenticatenaceae bacterium]
MMALPKPTCANKSVRGPRPIFACSFCVEQAGMRVLPVALNKQGCVFYQSR